MEVLKCQRPRLLANAIYKYHLCFTKTQISTTFHVNFERFLYR